MLRAGEGGERVGRAAGRVAGVQAAPRVRQAHQPVRLAAGLRRRAPPRRRRTSAPKPCCTVSTRSNSS